jgi:hypothetical protein
MRIRLFAVVAVLLFVSQNLWAKVHEISYNVASIIDLQDKDEINLVDFPTNWGYNRVVLGVNSIPGLLLSGGLATNDCDHALHDYYEELDFAYTGNDKIIYHGPAQRVPLQWWVDANPVGLSCKSYSESLKKDSIVALLYDFADSVYSIKVRNYRDLGELNSETVFEGSSGRFKITNLPDIFYNRITVQIVSMDGRELNGSAFAGGGTAEIDGFSAKINLEQKSLFASVFEIAFPEYRKVKLKWWVEVAVPDEKVIESSVVDLSSDSVEAEYSFDENRYDEKSVKIVYDKRNFADHRVPVIERLSFNPQGPNKSKDLGIRGEVYKVDAKLNPGDSAVIALPLNLKYQADKDSLTIESYVNGSNKWLENAADSVVDGFAYKKVGHLGLFSLKKVSRLVDDMVHSDSVVSTGEDASDLYHGAVDEYVNNAPSMLKFGWTWCAQCELFDMLKTVTCSGYEAKMKEIYGTPKIPDWDVEQGTVNTESILKKGRNVLDSLKKKRSEDLIRKSDVLVNEKCGGAEACLWKQTKNNLDILLADAILSQFPPNKKDPSLGKLRFSFAPDSNGTWEMHDADNLKVRYAYDDYFMVSSGFVEQSASFVLNLGKCYSSLEAFESPALRMALRWSELEDGLHSGACEAFRTMIGFQAPLNGGSACNEVANIKERILDKHSEKLISISESMVRISLLAWLGKANGFREYSLLRYKSAYDGVRAWLELAGPFFEYNNIVIKSYGSLALYEYIHYGTGENLKMLNAGLNFHYGDNGGYSEGMGYSQYLWDDLAYVLAVLKDAYESQFESEEFKIEEKFLKSPDYVFEFSRPVGDADKNGKYIHYGLIPVEADDGVTYNPDYRVWAKLKNDPRYLAMSEKYPLKEADKKINPLVSFGFPDISMYNDKRKSLPDRGMLWGDFKDGIGMITAVNGDDTVALSMIAESGDLWTRGQAHDQQDNLSITLASSKNGFLIQDPGYSGFNSKSSNDRFHRYRDHNVLTDYYGQSDNRAIHFDELYSRMSDFSSSVPGFTQSFVMKNALLYKKLHGLDYSFRVEGGDPAEVLDEKIEEPQNGIIGYTAKTKIAGGENHRTIMYFDENFWVVDRPSVAGLEWRVNSPKSTWEDLKIEGLCLYDTSLNQEILLKNRKVNVANVAQNGTRGDFDGNVLNNYSYSILGNETKSYVMTYSLVNEPFSLFDFICPKESQCFINKGKNIRLIVPPYGGKFRLCDALAKDECYGGAQSTGITILTKTSPWEWTARWVLDGNLYTVENGAEIQISSATVSKSYCLYERLDGSSGSEKYTGVYLPAIPILLLR